MTTLTTAPPAPDLAALFGRHVRLRPAGSNAKPTTRHGTGDLFGFLADIGSTTYLGLSRLYEPSHVRLVVATDYTISLCPYRRVHVFWYPYRDPFWTWCREIGGVVHDDYDGLPKCGSRTEAWDAAHEWLAAWAKKDAEAAR